MSQAPLLPAWVHKRDGRLVPFDADKISESLFAASESVGRPDAFLARELTDGILHFLAQESGGNIPTTAQIAELVGTIVRELGQPALAIAFAEECRRRLRAGVVKTSPTLQCQFAASDAPSAIVRACLREYSLHAVFSRDLCAAQQDGLLTLAGLENPVELGGGVLDLSTGQHDRADRVFQAVAEARKRFGTFLVLDSPEYWLAASASRPDRAAEFVDDLAAGLRANGLVGILNLNCAEPPAWADAKIAGPLFGEKSSAQAVPTDCLNELINHWSGTRTSASCLRLDWHLSEADFAKTSISPRLLRLFQVAAVSPALCFTLDRRRRPICLAEGVDRRHPGVLIAVALHLPRLLDLPGVARNSDKFLGKLASLTRMAVSAAVQKRNFLRRQPDLDHLRRGFFLDRARLVATPIGLETTLRLLTGEDRDSKSFLELGRRVLDVLRHGLQEAGAMANLDTTIDDQCLLAASGTEDFAVGWTANGFSPSCIHAVAALQSGAGGGTLAVSVPAGSSPGAVQMMGLLHFLWLRTDFTRVRFFAAGAAQSDLELQRCD